MITILITIVIFNSACITNNNFYFFIYQIWQSFISSREPNTGEMIRSPIIFGQKVAPSWSAFLKYSISQTLFIHMNLIIERGDISGRKGGIATGVPGEQGQRRTVRLQGCRHHQGMLSVSFHEMK